jgi:hypothetical protein
VKRKDPWYESDDLNRVTRNAFARVVGYSALAVLVVAIIGGGWWGVSVAISPAKGAGDAARQNNSAANRIASQQHFQDLYAAVTAEDQQLDQADADVKAHPGDSFYATNLTGITQECIRDRAQYNADANKVLLRDWQSPDLPHQIDPTAPATDCKPTNQPTP